MGNKTVKIFPIDGTVAKKNNFISFSVVICRDNKFEEFLTEFFNRVIYIIQ